MDDFDWIEELFDGESTPISNTQMSIIEGLLPTCAISIDERSSIENNLLELSNEEAKDLIYRLRDLEVPNDPKEQFKRMRF